MAVRALKLAALAASCLLAAAGCATLPDSDAVIQRRLAAAEDEMSHAVEFDYAIINNEFDEARRDLAAVIRAARLSLARQSARHPELFRPPNAA